MYSFPCEMDFSPLGSESHWIRRLVVRKSISHGKPYTMHRSINFIFVTAFVRGILLCHSNLSLLVKRLRGPHKVNKAVPRARGICVYHNKPQLLCAWMQSASYSLVYVIYRANTLTLCLAITTFPIAPLPSAWPINNTWSLVPLAIFDTALAITL